MTDHVAALAAAFDALTIRKKARLIVADPAFFYAAATLVRHSRRPALKEQPE